MLSYRSKTHNFASISPFRALRLTFAVKFPDSNGDNWLLTRDFAFIDLCFCGLLALQDSVEAWPPAQRIEENVSDRVPESVAAKPPSALMHSYCPG